MAAVRGITGLGRKTGSNIKHDTGKNAVTHGAYPNSSAGKNSGTARSGDPKGVKPMKGC